MNHRNEKEYSAELLSNDLKVLKGLGIFARLRPSLQLCM